MSGIPRFALNLADALLTEAPQDEFLFLVRDRPPPRLQGRPNAQFFRAPCPVYGLREQWVIPRILRRLKPDLFHTPTYAAPLACPCPLVMTVHDLIPMRFASEYGLRHRLYYPLVVRRNARRAACVTTVSECSRRDICDMLGVDGANVTVVPDAVDARFRAAPAPHLPRSKPYILAMGNEKPHKDMAPAVAAFELIASRGDWDLLLVGGVSSRLTRMLEASPQASRIRALDYVSEERLPSLYAEADLFVFPSRYEGFGLPPLEAMACGTPVVVFDTPAIEEICGDAAIRVPVGDAAALAHAMGQVLSDPARARALVRAGHERASRYSWDDTVRQMLDVYRRVLR